MIPLYPIFIKPARGFSYRRREDGLVAKVVLYQKFPGVLLVDRDGNEYWETRETFWHRYIHADLYGTERN